MSLSYKAQKKIILITFMLIPLALLLTFSYYPALDLVYLSMTSWDGVSPTKLWVGFQNYRELFSDPMIFSIFGHNLAYVLAGIVQVSLALFFAVLLNTKLKGRNVFKVIIFLPFIMNSVAVSYMFGYLYDPASGALNFVLGHMGMSNKVNWLGNPHLVNFSLGFINIWRFTGFNMVIFLGALQSIPKELYEAAQIDGASAIQTFRRITFPSIVSIIEVNMFLTITGAMEVFELPFILTKGGPIGASDTFVTKTIEIAFTFGNFGLASAMGVLLLAMVGIIVTIQKKIILRGGD